MEAVDGGGARPLTFVLTDVEGSTAAWEADAEAMSRRLRDHDRIIEGVVGAAGGRLVKTKGEGDATFSVFDEPAAAILAAVDLQRELLPTGLRVRVAVHTGHAEARDGDYFGRTVNRAARLRAVAHGGQVVVSDATAALVDGALPGPVALRHLGTHQLKDLERPEQVHQVLHSGLPQDFPALRSLDVRRHNLPRVASSFVGRDDDRRRLSEAVARGRCVTVVGPGGTGKTRLALEVAADLVPDIEGGAWIADLTPIRDRDTVAATIASAVGAEHPGPDAVGALVQHFDRPALLLLDNCEHVLDAAAEVAAAVVAAGDHVTVLATSRERLGVPGEVVVPLAPLPAADSRTLFLDRLQSLGASTDDASDAVDELCRELDHLPLALELAAARVPSLGLQAVVQRLDRRFRLLGSQSGDRRRTLSGLIGWSYDLLDDDESAAFRRLGALVGSWSLAVAEVVVGGDGIDEMDAAPLLASLVDKSLVVAAPADGGAVRYSMLETIRAFAAERLAEDPVERERTIRRLVGWAVERTADRPGLVDVDRVDEDLAWLRVLAGDIDAVRAAIDGALEIGAPTDALAVVSAAGAWGYRTGHWVEWRNRQQRALAAAVAAGGVPPHLLAVAHLHSGAWAATFGDHDEWGRGMEAALAHARRADDPTLLHRALIERGSFEQQGGDYTRGRGHFEEAVEVARRTGRPLLVARSLMGVATALGPEEHAERLLALEEAHAVGGPRIALALGSYELVGGLVAAAVRHFGEARGYFEATENLDGVMTVDCWWSVAEAWRGDIEKATARLEAALDVARSREDVIGEGMVLRSQVEVLVSAGHARRACEVADEQLRVESIRGFDVALGPGISPACAAALAAADVDLLRRRLEQAAAMDQRHFGVDLSLDVVRAGLSVLTGDAHDALRIVDEAMTTAERVGRYPALEGLRLQRAEANLTLDRLDDAGADAMAALERFGEWGLRPPAAEAADVAAAVAHAAGDHDLAARHLRRADDLRAGTGAVRSPRIDRVVAPVLATVTAAAAGDDES